MPPSRGFRLALLRRASSFRIKIKIREQLSILVALTAVTAVGVLSLIFVCIAILGGGGGCCYVFLVASAAQVANKMFCVQWVNNRRLIQSVSQDRISMAVSMKSAQISQTFAVLHHVAQGISTRSIVRSAMRGYEKFGNNTLDNWIRVEEDLRNAASARVGGFQEVLQVALFDARLGNGSEPSVNEGDYINGTWIGGLNNPNYNGTIANGTRVNIGSGTQSYLGLLNITGDNAIGIMLPPSPENGMMGEMMKRPSGSQHDRTLFWEEVARNRSEGKPVLDGFSMELFPVQDEYRNPNLTGDTKLIFTPQYIVEMGGLLLGPVIINSTFAMLSFTFPVFEQVNGVNVLPAMSLGLCLVTNVLSGRCCGICDSRDERKLVDGYSARHERTRENRTYSPCGTCMDKWSLERNTDKQQCPTSNISR